MDRLQPPDVSTSSPMSSAPGVTSASASSSARSTSWRSSKLRFTVAWHPFQLNPEMPAEGVDRAKYRIAKFGSLERSRQMDERITETAATVGIEFHLDKLTRTPNTRERPSPDPLRRPERPAGRRRRALFDDYFCNGADIGDAEDAGRRSAITAASTTRKCSPCWRATRASARCWRATRWHATAASRACRASRCRVMCCSPAPCRPTRWRSLPSRLGPPEEPRGLNAFPPQRSWGGVPAGRRGHGRSPLHPAQPMTPPAFGHLPTLAWGGKDASCCRRACSWMARRSAPLLSSHNPPGRACRCQRYRGVGGRRRQAVAAGDQGKGVQALH